MPLDGINGGTSAATYNAQTTLSATTSPKGAIDAGTTNPNEVLDAQRKLQATGPHKSDELAAPKPDATDDAEVVIRNLSLLNDEQVGADIFTAMALFQKMAQQMRNTARVQRAADLQTQVSELQSAAEKIRDAAAQRYNGAIVQGVMQIAGGVAQVGMGALSVRSAIKGSNLQNEANQLKADATAAAKAAGTAADLDAAGQFQSAATRASSMSSAWNQAGQGTGSIMGAIGNMGSARYNLNASEDDAARAKLESQANVSEAGVQQANDQMQQMMDVIRDVRDKLQAIQQSEVETNRSIARNI